MQRAVYFCGTYLSIIKGQLSMKNHLLVLLIVSFLFFLPFGSQADQGQPRIVRVGAFNYYPAIFKGADGVIKGFLVDALTEVAQRENIRFEYVYGSFSEGLERLKTGRVDVLTSIIYTPERATSMDYTKTPLLSEWGELYVPLKSDIDGIRDLQGKTVAVMKGDFNAAGFIDLAQKIGVSCRYVEVPGFEEVFKDVAEKKVDAGVVSNVFGVPKQHEYGLRPTGIVFSPFDVFFTVAKGKNQDLLALLDGYLDKWRHQKDSVYNSARQKWSHGSNGTLHVIPRWVITSTVVLAALVLGALVFILLLKRQVRRATEEIRQREISCRGSVAMVKLLLDSTAEAIYGLDTDGNCTFCNAACLRMLGYEQPEQLLGRNMHELIHHTHDDGTLSEVGECLIAAALRQGEELHADDEVLWRADGTSFASEYWAHPVRRDGKIVGSVVTFLDITERKQAEKKLQDKNRELERFTYTVSHDLKSPLITIQSYAGMIRQDMEAGHHERAKGDIKRIEGAAEKMTNLLNDLLELSRIGKQMNPTSLVDMSLLVTNVLSQLVGPLKQRLVDVVVQPDLPAVYGDHRRIAEALQNLVENAVKYMGDQPVPRVEIGCRQNDSEVVFFVGDNGQGIDLRHHEDIFGLFNQLDAKSEGTGVGLALVKRIIELHGGKVWVESEGGGMGSRFCFTLPLHA